MDSELDSYLTSPDALKQSAYLDESVIRPVDTNGVSMIVPTFSVSKGSQLIRKRWQSRNSAGESES